MKRTACILLALFLFFDTIPAKGETETSDLVKPSHLLPESLHEKWFQYRALRQQGETDASEKVFESLKQQAVDFGIENIDVLSAALLIDARKEYKKGNVEFALDLSEKAKEISPNYPPAYFLRGRFILQHKPWDITGIIGEYVNGVVQTMQHIWMLLYGVGAGLLWMVGAIGIATLLMILTMTLRYTPRLRHFLYETGKGKLSRLALSVLVAVILIGPIWFGLGAAWLMIWWIVIFWIFMTNRERGIAVVFIILVSSAGLWLPLWISVIQSKESASITVMSNSTRKAIGIISETLIPVDLGDDQRNGRVAMALGLQYRQSQQYDHARRYYERAMRLIPEDPRVLIDLGNIYFLEDKINEAISRYQQALTLDPNSVEAHYNLAQAYREKFLFNKGEQHYQTAMSLNAGVTQYYTDRALAGLTYPVVDASLGLSEVLFEVFNKDGKSHETANDFYFSIWSLPLQKAPLLLLGFGIVIIILQWRANKIRIPYPCSLCGRAICHYCQMHIFHLRICTSCQEANRKVKRLVELRQIQYRRDSQITYAKRFSILLPGIGHLLLRHSIKGFIFITVLFSIILSFIWKDVPSFVPYTGVVIDNGLGIAVFVIGLPLIYLTVFWDLARIQDISEG
jgi:tetratricopeptide (TPR) repeat protein